MLWVAVALAMIVLALMVWSHRRGQGPSPEPEPEPTDALAPTPARKEFPPQGLLVAESVMQATAGSTVDVWDALEASAAPVAVEYRPVSASELARYRMVPINASAQQALLHIVKALDPKSPTLYRVVLPKGAELVKAVGTEGFRGFSRSGGKTAHAVLKPVAAGGALAAGWPVFAVAGTVLAVDMLSQREQRANQERVEGFLERAEERHYAERIKDQRSADAQLSRAINLMLDGREPSMELALKSADDEFHRSMQFLDDHRGLVERLEDDEGKVDYRELERAFRAKAGDVSSFARDLHLARAAFAIKRKALVAHAAALALADPTNPYDALRRFLDFEAQQLEQSARAVDELVQELSNVKLSGPWHRREKTVLERQERLRLLIAPTPGDESSELCFVTSRNGEIMQLLPVNTEGDSHAGADPAAPS